MGRLQISGVIRMRTTAKPGPTALGRGSSPKGPPHVVKNATAIRPISVSRRLGGKCKSGELVLCAGVLPKILFSLCIAVYLRCTIQANFLVSKVFVASDDGPPIGRR